MEKEFWRRITRDEIITDYNTKAVNVDAYQKRDNNSDTARKGYKRNPTILGFHSREKAVPFRGTNMAAGKQQKHLFLSFPTYV